MKKTFYLLLSLLLSASMAYAQQKVTGQVTAAEDDSPLPGVTIAVKGTNVATLTDAEGKYSIAAADNATLIFSLVGFKQTEIAFKGVPINLAMVATTTLREAEITTSLGISKAKRQLGYAAQEVQGQDLVDASRDNVFEALQSRVAGINITSTGGAPGASALIQLRQPTSISNNNQPLIVVDGLIISNQTLNQHNLVSDGDNRNNDYTNRAADINPDDIASMTVLKGPEGALLYGMDAANGVIIITTKKGKAGVGRVSYSYSGGVSSLRKLPEIQQVYTRGTFGANDNSRNVYFGAKYPSGTQLYDNINNFFQDGSRQNHDLSFEGGTEQTTYRVNASYLNTKGNVPTTESQRINFKVGGSTKVGTKTNISASLTLVNTSVTKASRSAGGIFQSLLLWPSDNDITTYLNPDGTPRQIVVSSLAESVDNPFWDVYNNVNKDKTFRAFGSTNINYAPAKWIEFNANLGGDFSSGQGQVIKHPLSVTQRTTKGNYEEYINNTRFLNFTGFMTLHKDLVKDLASTLRLGGAIDDRVDYTLSSNGQQFFATNNFSLQNVTASTIRSRNYEEVFRRASLFGEISFDYKRIITLTGQLRNDNTSTLAPENRSVWLPGANASFVFSDLFKPMKNFNYGKIRVAVTKAAKDISPYSLDSRLAVSPLSGGGFAYDFLGNSRSLKYEEISSLNLGLEMAFLNNRLTIDANYFKQNNDNQLLKNVRLSYGTGFVLNNINAANVRTDGVELTIGIVPIKRKDFKWDIFLNFAKSTSLVENLTIVPEYYNSDIFITTARAAVIPGKPITGLSGYTYERNNAGQVLIDANNGLPRVLATNTYIGDRNPDFNIGLTNKLTVGGFTFSFALDIRKGGDVFNGNEFFLWQNGLSKRSLNREQPVVFNGVYKDGNENTTPTVNTIQVTPQYQNAVYNARTPVEDFIEKNVNWVRLRDARITYAMPFSLLKTVGIFSKFDIFVSGSELFLISNYSGLDPNVNGITPGSTGPGGAGYDYGVLPNPRTINFGVNIGF
jgi:TonB-linked SusC/RagA family outer membrane protein